MVTLLVAFGLMLDEHIRSCHYHCDTRMHIAGLSQPTSYRSHIARLPRLLWHHCIILSYR